ncbi:hypothetical protein EYF80_006466 [Liparis tanakae]|uniref:Uncharacterized protein n=1 Tax=Liparis tanakae TaxID=230148 RepID=A0A4Z2IZM0_9TELE|nr:hypothetical protein EYF80_006466 [Liparis tanakae]
MCRMRKRSRRSRRLKSDPSSLELFKLARANVLGVCLNRNSLKMNPGPSGKHTGTHSFTCVIVKAGCVEFAHVELQADDGEHEDGKEKKQADLQQRNHGLHDGLEHHL